MIKPSHQFVLILMASVLTCCSQPQPELTIVTYNIRHGVGMDRMLDLERTARVLEAAKPDFVVLNEVDNGTERSFGVYQADSLGKLLGMEAVFARSIDYDGGQYGNALLSHHPILEFKIIDLSMDSLLEGRSVFQAKLLVHEDTLVIMGTHLGLSNEERTAQVIRILRSLPESERVLLAGDFNFEPDSDTYHLITEKMLDGVLKLKNDTGFTFPADKPLRRIDYIFIASAITPVQREVFDHPELVIASDHRPQVFHFK